MWEVPVSSKSQKLAKATRAKDLPIPPAKAKLCQVESLSRCEAPGKSAVKGSTYSLSAKAFTAHSVNALTSSHSVGATVECLDPVMTTPTRSCHFGDQSLSESGESQQLAKSSHVTSHGGSSLLVPPKVFPSKHLTIWSEPGRGGSASRQKSKKP